METQLSKVTQVEIMYCKRVNNTFSKIDNKMIRDDVIVRTASIGYSKKSKFWSWTLVTQGIFVMTLLDNLSQKFAQKKHIFPSLIANSFYKGI